MDKKLLISLLEAIYVVYMFRIFKTTVSMNLIPLKFLDYSSYLIHQKENSSIPVSHICKFGHDMAVVIAIFLILRNYMPKLMKYNKTVLGLIIFGCFMNLNALIYFLPVVVIEYNLV